MVRSFHLFNRNVFILLTKMRTKTKTVPSTWYIINVQGYTHSDFSHMCLILLLAYMMNRRILIGKSAALRMLSWLPICLLFWWFYLLSVWWLGKYCYVKIRLYGTIVAALVRTKSNGRFVKKKKISRNGLGIFHNSANDRDRWALLIFCCQSNIWCLIMSTQPTLCPTNTHTPTKRTLST